MKIANYNSVEQVPERINNLVHVLDMLEEQKKQIQFKLFGAHDILEHFQHSADQYSVKKLKIANYNSV